MTALEARKLVQKILNCEADGQLGAKSRSAFERLALASPNSEWPPQLPSSPVESSQVVPPTPIVCLPTKELKGDGTWAYAAKVVGDDIVCENIMMTSFGGWGGGNNADPQDSGATASGKNTKRDWIEGVSIAMDSRFFPSMGKNDPAGYKALFGAPFPKIPWGTLVEITIGTEVFIPKDGIVDLGPGKRASKPGEPHALDLTPPAAQHFAPKTPIYRLATGFSAWGSFRIIGAAKFVA